MDINICLISVEKVCVFGEKLFSVFWLIMLKCLNTLKSSIYSFNKSYCNNCNISTFALINNGNNDNFNRYYSVKNQKEAIRSRLKLVKEKKKKRQELKDSMNLKEIPKSNLSFDKITEKLDLLVGNKTSAIIKESVRSNWHQRFQQNTTNNNKTSIDSGNSSGRNRDFKTLKVNEKLLEKLKEKQLGRFRQQKEKKGTTKLDAIRKNVIGDIERFFGSRFKFIGGAKSKSSFIPESLPEVAFIGRSNVGKSSLINALTQRGLAKTSDKPGHTQSINWFELGSTLYLVDLPGYGFAFAKSEKVDHWSQLTREYMLSRKTLKCVFVLLDSRHGLKESDRELLGIFEKNNIKSQVVLTKCDLITQVDLAKRIQIVTSDIVNQYNRSNLPILSLSSKNYSGIADLSKIIKGFKLRKKPIQEVQIPIKKVVDVKKDKSKEKLKKTLKLRELVNKNK